MRKISNNSQVKLYLESYTFFDYINSVAMVYNEINYSIIEFHDNNDDIVKNIFVRFLESNQNWIFLSTEEFNNKHIKRFIRLLKRNYSGDYVKGSNVPIFAIKHKIHIADDIEYMKIDDNYSISYNLKKTLTELTINTGSYLEATPNGNNTIFKAVKVGCNRKYDLTPIRETIANSIPGYPNLETINIICYPNSDYLSIRWLLKNINSNKNIFIHVDISELNNAIESLDIFGCSIIVYGCINDIINANLVSMIRNGSGYSTFSFLITVNSYMDIKKVLDISNSINYDIDIYPNLKYPSQSFLRNNVYIDRNDIMEQKLSLKKILTNGIINACFFGKAYIDEQGNIKSNMLEISNLNLASHSITDYLYDEIKNKKKWFLTRQKIEPCMHCHFRYLCPPISMVELTLDTNSLCKIYK